MNNTYINTLYEEYFSLTAGRFYSDKERECLAELVLDANLVYDKSRDSVKAVLLNRELEGYRTLQDCANGLLLLVSAEAESQLIDALTAKKSVFLSKNKNELFPNRVAWLKYARTCLSTAEGLLENAAYCYACGKNKEAKEGFFRLAEAQHYFSVKAAAAICRVEGNFEAELDYLTLVERICTELYGEELSNGLKQRLACFPEDRRNEAFKNAEDVKLEFFDDNDLNRSVLGFRF